MIISENLKKKRMMYYNKIYVLFELVKAMKNREVVFMDRTNNWFCVRGLYVKTVDYLKEFFRVFNFFEKDYNIYISSALYKELPMFTYNLKERSNQTQEFFHSQIQDYVIGYDCVLDFDVKTSLDYFDMIAEIKFLLSILDFERIKYYIIPSGRHFQVTIPSDTFPFSKIFDKSEHSFQNRIKVFTENLIDVMKLKYVDLKNVGVLNRIVKCPYSLVLDKVCLPLISFNNFHYELVDCNTVLKNVILKERGIYQFNNYEHNVNNMDKFIDKYKLQRGLIKW